MVSRKDEFFEQKTPAHDALQLYFAKHLGEITSDFTNRFIHGYSKVQDGTLDLKTEIRLDEPITKAYQRTVYVDALLELRHSHRDFSNFVVCCVKGYSQYSKFFVACSSHFPEAAESTGDWHYNHSELSQTPEQIEMSFINAETSNGISDDSRTKLKQKAWNDLKTFVLEHHLNVHSKYCKILVEFKPRIYSFGDVLRQIKEYRSRVEPDFSILYTPDRRFDEDFLSENIICLHPEMDSLLAFAQSKGLSTEEWKQTNSTSPEEDSLSDKGQSHL